MTSRERLRRAIEFTGPDRAPLWPRFEGTAWIRHGRALLELLDKYPVDLGGRHEVPDYRKQPLTWTDDWGCGWRRERKGFFGTVVQHPLEDRDTLKAYRFPDYTQPEYDERFDNVVRRYAERDRDRYAMTHVEYGVLWYRMWWLRGMANAMEDTARDDGFIEELRDRILETRLGYLRRILKADVDGVGFGDDWGTQDALMISPDRWRVLFKPAYKRLFDEVHAAGKHVILETDGCTTDILEDWAEIGVDLLSVQLNVVGLDNAARLRGRTCVYSDPDRQDLLPNSSPEAVAEHVREIVETFNTPKGGLVGCLYVTEGVPLENVEAALDAFLRYGQCGEADD